VVPAESELEVNVATPLAFSEALPRFELPSKNEMLPEGVPLAEEIVAVNVTVAPAAAGFGDAARERLVVAGAAAFTTSDTADDVLAA
jgi:hypothetical protein